jgi:hypothetical protein
METVISAQEHWRRKYARMEQFLLVKVRWDAAKGTGTEDPEDVRRIGIPLRPKLQSACEGLIQIQKKYAILPGVGMSLHSTGLAIVWWAWFPER